MRSPSCSWRLQQPRHLTINQEGSKSAQASFSGWCRATWNTIKVLSYRIQGPKHLIVSPITLWPTVETVRETDASEADQEHSAVIFGVPHRHGLVQQLAQQPRLARRVALAPQPPERVPGERRHRGGVAQLRGELRAARVQFRQPLVHEVDSTLTVEDLSSRRGAAVRGRGRLRVLVRVGVRMHSTRTVCVCGEIVRDGER